MLPGWTFQFLILQHLIHQQLMFLHIHYTLWLKFEKPGRGCPFRVWLLVDGWGTCGCWDGGLPKWCKAGWWEEYCGVKPRLKGFPLTAGIWPVAILSRCTSSLNASFKAAENRSTSTNYYGSRSNSYKTLEGEGQKITKKGKGSCLKGLSTVTFEDHIERCFVVLDLSTATSQFT